MGPGLQVLPLPGPHRGGHPRGVPLGLRWRHRSRRACTVLFRLPHVPLPSWAAGVQLGGPVTLEGTVSALYDGLRLGTLLCCLGAANTLANPKRALRVLPGALYELGVAVVVSLSVAPQLVESVQRVRRARKLRGGAPDAASMPSGASPSPCSRTPWSVRCDWPRPWTPGATGGPATPRRRERRMTGAFMIAGMCGLCIGAYGLLDGSALGLSALPALVAGAVLCCVGLLLGGRQVQRSQYRPDPWKAPEWIVSACGVVPAVVLLAGVGCGASRASTPRPTRWRGPPFPVVPALAILVGRPWPRWPPPPPIRAAPIGGQSDHRTGPGASDRRLWSRPGLRPRPVGVPAVIEFEQVSRDLRRGRRAPVLRDVDLQHRGGRAGPGGRADRCRASPRCWGPSTAWFPTSPGGRWPDGWWSTAGTPAPTSPGSWPTSWAWSARTRWPAS